MFFKVFTGILKTIVEQTQKIFMRTCFFKKLRQVLTKQSVVIFAKIRQAGLYEK